MLQNILHILTPLMALTIMPIRDAHGSAVLIADLTMSKMIELSSRHPFCKMHKDRGDIQRMLLASDPRRVRQVPMESVESLENVCAEAGSHGHDFRGGLGFIYPGTKWCGPGSVAANHDDLGRYTEEDRCCREHDLCPNILTPGDCRRGLCNTGTFTRSHCDCDARFRRCLQSLNTETANTLGAIFFNVVQVTCFQERSPCSDRQRLESLNETHNSTECTFIYTRSEIYIPHDNSHILSKIVQKPSLKKSLAKSLLVSSGGHVGRDLKGSMSLSDVMTFLKIKLASLGFVAANLFKEMLNWPKQDSILNARQEQNSSSKQES